MSFVYYEVRRNVLLDAKAKLRYMKAVLQKPQRNKD